MKAASHMSGKSSIAVRSRAKRNQLLSFDSTKDMDKRMLKDIKAWWQKSVDSSKLDLSAPKPDSKMSARYNKMNHSVIKAEMWIKDMNVGTMTESSLNKSSLISSHLISVENPNKAIKDQIIKPPVIQIPNTSLEKKQLKVDNSGIQTAQVYNLWNNSVKITETLIDKKVIHSTAQRKPWHSGPQVNLYFLADSHINDHGLMIQGKRTQPNSSQFEKLNLTRYKHYNHWRKAHSRYQTSPKSELESHHLWLVKTTMPSSPNNYN